MEKKTRAEELKGMKQTLQTKKTKKNTLTDKTRTISYTVHPGNPLTQKSEAAISLILTVFTDNVNRFTSK